MNGKQLKSKSNSDRFLKINLRAARFRSTGKMVRLRDTRFGHWACGLGLIFELPASQNLIEYDNCVISCFPRGKRTSYVDFPG